MKNSLIKKSQKAAPALDQSQIVAACWIAVKKLNPRSASKNPVMFVVLVGTILSAGITLHMELLYGSNNHHICESLYKGFARAMRQAVERDPRKGGAIPSTKGQLGG